MRSAAKLPVHYQPDSPLHTSCGIHVLTIGQVTIGTNDPAGVTCSRCLMSPAMTGHSPITGAELADLMGRARGVLKESRGAAAAQIDRDERRHRIMLALDALHAETPWWALLTRHWISRQLAALASA